VARTKKAVLSKPKTSEADGDGPGVTKKVPPATEGRNKILIITHNGNKPMLRGKPKNGGLRLAYQVGNERK